MSNEKRVNLEGIFSYKPWDNHNHLISNKPYYFILIEYLNGEKEQVGFLHNKKKRDDYLKMLDENLLKE